LKLALSALNEIEEKSKFATVSFDHKYNHQFMELDFMMATAKRLR
jgi:hypothetical protein